MSELEQMEMEQMERKPHMKSMLTTRNIMFFMLLALMPSTGFGIYNYGIHALWVVLISVGSAVVFETLWDVIVLKKTWTIMDYSAAVTGLILGLILPPGVPLYFPVIGAAIAILCGKMVFGGIGRNILNPAMTGKLVLLLIFRVHMLDFSCGSYSAVTPLSQLLNGNTINLHDMVSGNVAGTIGTVSILMMTIGVVFLMIVGVLDGMIPFFAIISFIIGMGLFGGHAFDPAFIVANLIGGGFLFTVFFMLTDYTTSPVTIVGKVYYGILFGVFTCIIRLTFSDENACVCALLLCNLLARVLDRITMPKPFGTKKRTHVVKQIRKEQETKEQEMKEQEMKE